MKWGMRAPGAFLALAATLAGSAGPDDLSARLDARSGNQEQSIAGQAATAPPGTRPVLNVKAGAPIRVKWSVTNGDKPGVLHDVTVHCFLAREEAPGQREAPKLGTNAVYESALMMDFAAKARSTADFSLQAPSPGIYLLRVETIGAAKEHGHEHYAAMDIKVQ
jgi:hypothetical protein